MSKFNTLESLIMKKIGLQTELASVQSEIQAVMSSMQQKVGAKAKATKGPKAVKVAKVAKGPKKGPKAVKVAKEAKTPKLVKASKESSEGSEGPHVSRFSDESMAAFAHKFPTFNAFDLENYFGISRSYARLKIHEMCNQAGTIKRVERGVYSLKAA